MKIKVAAKKDSFWRAKMKWTKDPQIVDVDEKTYEILKAEPMLIVEEVALKPVETKPKKGGGRG